MNKHDFDNQNETLTEKPATSDSADVEVEALVAEALAEQQAPEIEVLYEDEHLVAIHKPAGLLVHRSYLARKEKFFAMQLTRDKVGCHVFPIHRLDRPTSGVLLFAKSSEVANLMCQQFEQHTIEKCYLALVRGNILQGDILDYALKYEADDIGDKYAAKDKAAQDAVTEYQPLANCEIPYSSGRYPTSRYGLVRLLPKTGRKHQLRRHMAHLRHPIVGDTTHGDGKQNRFFREHTGINRLWLIAKSLSFTHPITHTRVHIETELENEWLTVFNLLGMDDCLDSGAAMDIAAL
ncbi:tRNA pseudouridine(65) synthase TruC [Shewanella maritima]|uniref:tRNA pseudouridine synthase C n=1 Tax=Shewanella maritima TaxID=2520507 RepID=A0A411PE45_9GAMM|nr:tRNA pseudouridine(65) synthase TruC [Shewanella maritima]QBF81732.1 tRNA pseudouridine(65) synthase TruC [Shewanella maritima]